MKQQVNCSRCGADLGIRETYLFEMYACRPCAAKNNQAMIDLAKAHNASVLAGIHPEGTLHHHSEDLDLRPVPDERWVPSEYRIVNDSHASDGMR
jgi:ribosomal protein L40E